MIKTPHLKSILAQYKDILSSDEVLSFENEVDRLLNHYLVILSELPAGGERGKKVHALIEEQLSAQIKTSCQWGCGACSHLELEITLDDAMVMA